MGSNDIPPPHIPFHVVPMCNLFLQIGGSLWTLCYILFIRESFRSRSYGIPLFALALNFSWEAVYALYVAESWLEKFIFSVWLVLDCGMVYGMVRFGGYEWRHSPFVARHIAGIFVVMMLLASLGQWCFAKWWIENDIGQREGKFYRGVVGPDTSELGFWSAAVTQANLSVMSLCMLVVRQHSGGVSWAIWGTRIMGSVIGFYAVYAWDWWFWPEAHGYFVSPFGLFLWVGALVADCVYAFVLWRVKKIEMILPDGRKAARSAAVEAKRRL